MVLLYRCSLSDNDSYAFRDYPQLTDSQQIHQELVPDFSGSVDQSLRCKACGELLDKWSNPPPTLVIKKRKYDIGITYDGITTVSQRFKSVYEEAGLTGLVFRALPADPAFFMITASRVVLFDAERRQTRFEKRCSVCGHFESVVGATPVCLKVGTVIGEREFVRTDLEFASNDEKHPLLLCGEVAAKSLSAAKLKGLDLTVMKDVFTFKLDRS
jgi:hypothetical protein